jgi:hypothetical protein
MEQPERLKLGEKARRSDASTGRKNPQALSVCSQVPPRVKQAHEKRGIVWFIREVLRFYFGSGDTKLQ